MNDEKIYVVGRIFDNADSDHVAEVIKCSQEIQGILAKYSSKISWEGVGLAVSSWFFEGR